MYRHIIIVIFGLLFTFSCVSTQKYEILESENKSLKLNEDELIDLRQRYQSTKKELESAQQTLKKNENTINGLNNMIGSLNESYDVLQSDFKQLSSQNNIIVNSSAESRNSLEKRLFEKEEQLDKQQKLLAKREKELQERLQLQKQQEAIIFEREKEIGQLNASLLEQKKGLTQLKQDISSSLSSFSLEELQVEQMKHGKVYVSLSQQLLFKKGSDQVDTKGVDAISKLAEILATKDFDVLIEGHTDSDGSVDRNWDLSVMRATAVVKILQENGIDPKRLTASGKAFYAPKAENTTEEQKSKNRRIEIIISPKLDKIYELINKTK